MRKSLEILPTGPLDATIRPPGSKSITNRALVCAALADGTSTLRGALDSEDTQVMAQGLRQLGIDVASEPAPSTASNGPSGSECPSRGNLTLTVAGCGGVLPAGGADLYVANSGTTVRFLTAMVTLGHGTYRLDGTPRMRERPVGDLLDTLGQLGADATSQTGNDCPPVVVRAAGLGGGKATIRGDISSQFLSGLLMVSPCAGSEVDLRAVGPLVSQPYVRMTLEVMRAFGVDVATEDLGRFTVPTRPRYRACTFDIEPDASAASYFWGAAAIAGGKVTVEGLTRDAIQGDVGFCQCLQRMGCRVQYGGRGITVHGGTLTGIDVNMNAMSDTVQTLAAVALFARGPTTMTGVAHIRHKETDRIGDLARELRKLGAEVEELPDGLRIVPAPPRGATIETYNDHRMAMSMALVGLRVPGVVIENPECTGKTYPRFFEDLQSL